MAVAAGTVFEVSFKQAVNGQVMRNYLHYTNLGEIVGIDPPDVAQDMLTSNFASSLQAGVGDLLACQSSSVELLQTSVQPVFETRYRKQVIDHVGVNGAIMDTCPAQNVQASISKFGLLANKENRGGNRIGGLASGYYTAGDVGGALKTLLLSLAATWYSPISVTILGVPTTFQPVILNRENIGTPENPQWIISGWTQVFTYQVHDQLRTQRSRTKGKGE